MVREMFLAFLFRVILFKLEKSKVTTFKTHFLNKP